MNKKLHIKLILLVILIDSCLFAQNTVQQKQIKVIATFVEAYNQQNYTKIKKNFFLIGRILPIKKSLKAAFEPRFNKYGKAILDTCLFIDSKKVIVDITYEKDATEKDALIFYFSNHNKIMGLNFKSPNYTYSKSSETKSTTKQSPILKIDSLVALKSTKGFNGTVLVIDGGKEIYKKYVGFSNFDSKTFINDTSIFELASCSKQFTAMAIMILAQQGKLNYTDTIQKFISKFPYKNITIENLLTHTSGLPDYMELLQKHWDKQKFATNDDIVDLFIKYKPKVYYAPNQAFDYSNTGYAMLSVIIEKVSGLSYTEFLDKYIFNPLGMKNTRVYNTRRSKNEKIDNYAYGYIYSDKLKKYVLPDSLADYKYVIYLDAITGDGTVNTNVLDLAKWDKALREHALVQKSTLDKAFTPYKLKDGTQSNYGYGQIIVNDNKSEKVVYHGGSWPGYNTFILHFIERETSIIVLSNNEYEGTDKLVDEIAKIILGVK